MDPRQGNKLLLNRVRSATDLEEILDDFSKGLVTVLYGTPTCKYCKEVKPYYLKLAQIFRGRIVPLMFVYIDLLDFQDKDPGFTQNVTDVPLAFIYYQKEIIAEEKGSFLPKRLAQHYELILKRFEERQTKNAEEQKVREDEGTSKVPPRPALPAQPPSQLPSQPLSIPTSIPPASDPSPHPSLPVLPQTGQPLAPISTEFLMEQEMRKKREENEGILEKLRELDDLRGRQTKKKKSKSEPKEEESDVEDESEIEEPSEETEDSEA